MGYRPSLREKWGKEGESSIKLCNDISGVHEVILSETDRSSTLSSLNISSTALIDAYADYGICGTSRGCQLAVLIVLMVLVALSPTKR